MKKLSKIILSTTSVALVSSFSASVSSCGQEGNAAINSVSFTVNNWGDYGFGTTTGKTYSRNTLDSTITSWKTNSGFSNTFNSAYKNYNLSKNTNSNFILDMNISSIEPTTGKNVFAMPFYDVLNFAKQNNKLAVNKLDSLSNMYSTDFPSANAVHYASPLTHLVTAENRIRPPSAITTPFLLNSYSDTQDFTSLMNAIFNEVPKGNQSQSFADFLFLSLWGWTFAGSNDFKNNFTISSFGVLGLINFPISVLNPTTNKIEYGTISMEAQAMFTYNASTKIFGVTDLAFFDSTNPVQTTRNVNFIDWTISNFTSNGKNIFQELDDTINSIIA